MPTTKPRIFLTLGEKDVAALGALTLAWGLKRPSAIRKAVREAARRIAKPGEAK